MKTYRERVSLTTDPGYNKLNDDTFYQEYGNNLLNTLIAISK